MYDIYIYLPLRRLAPAPAAVPVLAELTGATLAGVFATEGVISFFVGADPDSAPDNLYDREYTLIDIEIHVRKTYESMKSIFPIPLIFFRASATSFFISSSISKPA
jgi:hypothetical protein